MKVELDSYNYSTKTDLKTAARVDTSFFAKFSRKTYCNTKITETENKITIPKS